MFKYTFAATRDGDYGEIETTRTVFADELGEAYDLVTEQIAADSNVYGDEDDYEEEMAHWTFRLMDTTDLTDEAGSHLTYGIAARLALIEEMLDDLRSHLGAGE